MRAIGGAAFAAVVLVVVYLALGGATYAPAKVADPCATREWRNAKGLERVAEQIVLSALDGAACEVGASREEIVLAFAGRDSLRRFAHEHGISQQRLEELVRAGLIRAIDDADGAGALNPGLAEFLRGVVSRIPVAQLLDVLGRFGSL
jgi:hypothetical protein